MLPARSSRLLLFALLLSTTLLMSLHLILVNRRHALPTSGPPLLAKREANSSSPSSETGNSTFCPEVAVEFPPELPPLINVTSQVENLMTQPIINPHFYGYVHNPRDICSSDKQVDILFVVPSAPENVWKRRKVRKFHQGLYRQLRHYRNTAVLFFLGIPDSSKPESALAQALVCAEVRKYGDIVQENFTDIYHNIRLKAVSMLRWASSYCPKATYVIRTDDDVLISTNSIIKSIQKIGVYYDNFIVGDVKKRWNPIRLHSNKYYVSMEEYSNNTYPPFAVGGLLGYPSKTVRLLYEASLRVRPLWLDDVYITGICAIEVGAVLLKDAPFRFRHLKEEYLGGVI